MDIQRISDELEIASVLHRYARAVDGQDWVQPDADARRD